MSKLKFKIKLDNRTIDSSYLSSNNGSVVIENVEGDLEKVFEFALELAEKEEIKYRERKYKKNREKVLEVTFDNGKYILDEFNKQINKQKIMYKLKKGVIISGSIASAFAVIGVSLTINSKKNVKSSKESEVSIESDIDNHSFKNNYTPNVSYKNDINVSENYIKEKLESNKNNEKVKTDDASKVVAEEVKFSYEDRSNDERVDKASKYDKFFEDTGKMYGIDPILLKAIMCQESGGVHLNYSQNGHAYGGMQIESINFGSTMHTYNFNKNKEEDFTISSSKINDASYNIKTGAILLQYQLEKCDYDVAKAVQSYNFGEGSMRRLGSNWRNNRKSLNIGDPEYMEHVFSFIPDETTLTFKKRDGTEKTIILNNTKVNEKEDSKKK